jgi:hypothetical protein
VLVLLVVLVVVVVLVMVVLLLLLCRLQADHLTFTLGAHGYQAYKYVPYGPLHEVLPYLVRRAQENAGMLKNSGAFLAFVCFRLLA